MLLVENARIRMLDATRSLREHAVGERVVVHPDDHSVIAHSES